MFIIEDEIRFLRELIAVCDWLYCERLQRALAELEALDCQRQKARVSQ